MALSVSTLQPSAARAFSTPDTYGRFPSEYLGGGGGRFFTGSPADGYDCSVCHTARNSASFPVVQKGLPVDGYIPGTVYTIELTWPDATLGTLSAERLGLRPLSSLVAEFVAEDGGNAGSITLPSVLTTVEDLCKPKPGETVGALAAMIFSAASNAETVQLRGEKDVCNTAGDGARRCVLAVQPCGASKAQVRWTAPSQWGGPVWFSAGFVMTYDADGVPTYNDNGGRPHDDYVTALSIPMNARSEGPTYETRLDSGCSVRGVAKGRGGHTWAIAILGLWLLRRWRKLRAARTALAKRVAALSGRGLALLGLLAALSCDDDERDADKYPANFVGRFEPGNKPDGGFADTGPPPKCVSIDIPEPAADAGPAPAGKLRVTFQMVVPPNVTVGHWDRPGTKPNFGVVWIEDSMGRFVKTLELWGQNIYTTTTLTFYFNKRTYCNLDVVSRATPIVYELHDLSWDTKDSKGNVVPDGTYKLWINAQIDESHPMEPYSVDFIKGPAPSTLQPPPVAPHSGLTLTYTPG